MKSRRSKPTIHSVDKADLYKEPGGKKIASVSVSSIGYIVAWHEFVPQKISQRLSSIWYSREAAELIIFAAYSETLECVQRKIEEEKNK